MKSINNESLKKSSSYCLCSYLFLLCSCYESSPCKVVCICTRCVTDVGVHCHNIAVDYIYFCCFWVAGSSVFFFTSTSTHSALELHAKMDKSRLTFFSPTILNNSLPQGRVFTKNETPGSWIGIQQ